MANSTSARRFCFTINNPVSRIQEDHPDVRYLVYQKETAPTTGTPHFQGYMEVKKTVRFSWIHSNIGGMATASIRVANGTAAENRIYCTKEGRIEGPWEFGEMATQGKRSDLLSVKRSIDEGASDEQLADEHFSTWCRYNKSFTLYKKLKSQKRDFKTYVVFLYGPPGTGKSSYIRDNSPNVHWQDQTKWFDGYDGTSDIALDDFYGWIPYSQMLRLMDRYPTDVEVKGAKVNFAPRRLYISSNKMPSQWYSENVPYNHDAFFRRIDEIIYMPTLGEATHYFPPGQTIPPGNTFADFHIHIGTFHENSVTPYS